MDQRSLKILEYDKIIHSLSRLTQSEPGRRLCLKLKPVSDYERVLVLQNETDDAVRQLMKKGPLPINGVTDIRPAVERSAAGSRLSLKELLQIGSVCRTVQRLKSQLTADSPPAGVLEQLIRQLAEVPDLQRRIEQAIASEDELYDQASAELARIRRRIRETQNQVKESLQQIVRSHGKALQEQLVTLRGDRYVVPVKAEHRQAIPGLVHDTSASGATLFIEPMQVIDLNNRIRELSGLEQDEIDRIIQELSERVADVSELLIGDLVILAELDFIQARGQLALSMDAMRPQINTAGRIRLLSARHPLIPRDRVVPIDIELGNTFRTLVITGPNTGGKTVALKTCGLFSLMALAGLQIPARSGSEITILQDVLADIGDEQSIEQDLSTFSSHMRNLVRILEQADSDTLVLADELGSGTDPTEGAALAVAILEYLRQKGCLTVATTHYKELKAYALQTPDVENACCEFDAETLQPTFRLLIGVPGVSNAFAISSKLGLNPEVIAMAKQAMSDDGIHFEDLVRAMERSRSQAEEDRRLTEAARKEAEQLAEELRKEKKKLETEKNKSVKRIKEQVQERYADALNEIEEMLKSVRTKMQAEDLAESQRMANQIRSQIRSDLNRVQDDLGSDAALAEGDKLKKQEILIGEIYAAPAYGLSGRLVAGPDNRGYYQLQNESVKVTVPQDALRRLSNNGATTKQKRRQSNRRTGSSLTAERHLDAHSEIQLLGQTVQEATETLDKFIDDAVLGGIHSIRIVHGKGTGALRQAVQVLLRNDPRVDSFRLGVYGEGDSGVTLAVLK
jgi:DNA mismatch repair protein MutS2